MNYVIKPTLERRALVEIVISLWNCNNVRSLIDKFHVPLLDDQNELYRYPRYKEWQRIEDTVVKNVPHLVLPESLKKKILHLIKPVGFQILHWMVYHKFCHLDGIRPNKLCWKQQGTVDQKRTAEALINDDNLDATIRFQLACINCLKDDILQLWNKMPANWSDSFCNNESDNRQQELTVFWTYDMKGELYKMHNRFSGTLYPSRSPYQFAFQWAALNGNKVATEYFLKKLTEEEKEESLVKTATKVAKKGYELHAICYSLNDYPQNVYAEVLCFLLSQMDEDKQLQVFQDSPYNVLTCLLDWPWQDCCREAANHMWEFMPDECFYQILEEIVRNQLSSSNNCCYQELFAEFWQHGLTTHRKYVVHECVTNGGLLRLLFMVGDKESIKLIWKETTDEEKETIVFQGKGKQTFEYLIISDMWDLLTFFLQQCISCTNIRIRFEKEFEEHVKHRCSKTLPTNKLNNYDKLWSILEDLLYNDDKK